MEIDTFEVLKYIATLHLSPFLQDCCYNWKIVFYRSDYRGACYLLKYIAKLIYT